ncbi:hypothetical protein RJ640_027678 [Escallonia rubra]|uniref:Uncharacterized protein n=1 Tax=Escallonia rubra TaxID=112253 RepID=A0AA88S1H0_9ASTE|nr:hypothetical protein RJ640_027678 [Escallonia rubra]
MSKFFSRIIIWIILLLSCLFASDSASWCPYHYTPQPEQRFVQKSDKFWEFEEESKSWVEVKLPRDLVSCVNDNCTKVGRIDSKKSDKHLESETDVPKQKGNSKKKDGIGGKGGNSVLMPMRKGVSLIKMSEASIWVTGKSGSIYERFWNGLKWVVAPHDLPVSAGYAVAVFFVNQTILALSEAGRLYQMQLSENSQPLWAEFAVTVDHSIPKEAKRDSPVELISGVLSQDREWINHGRPPGANVAAITDGATVIPELVFTVSSAGDLYEYDKSSKPSWKKHIWREGSTQDTFLTPSTGCSLHGTSGAHSMSLFLLTKGGNLVERQLHQRKWKWIIHGSPKDHHLTSMTPRSHDELNEKSYSLLLTTAAGFVFEYQVPKHPGTTQENQAPKNWVNHMHPPHAKVARGMTGIQYQVGRTFFPLDDGRLGELHLSGLGGESSGPIHQVNVRRKASSKYVWSILDAPESEGWNAEYCTEEHGPLNCILGIKDEPTEEETARTTAKRRKGSKAQEIYLSLDSSGGTSVKSTEGYSIPENWINKNFRLRAMPGGRSFFLVTDSGLTFEYLNAESVWFWLRHEHSTAMKGALGSYNGSLFLVDEHKSLLMRERSKNELTWINCTAMRKGRHVIGGPPWDGVPGKTLEATAEDALYFVSKSGRLLQLTVALRKFKWKDCRNPPHTKIACIVDQEVFRENVVFVVGRNGRLYQYNKVNELWHEHYQSQHLILSRLPGTAMRPSSQSLTGSLFMLSEDGRLVEYHWNSLDGWNWVEHGTPSIGVTLVGSPGPCFGGDQLFLIGSDSKVYLRYLNQATWKWKDCAFPYKGHMVVEDETQVGAKPGKEEACINKDFRQENLQAVDKYCDPKVSTTRPIPLAEESVIFELRDGRLAEMRLTEEKHWVWSRTIGTPTSLCSDNYWTALAS